MESEKLKTAKDRFERLKKAYINLDNQNMIIEFYSKAGVSSYSLDDLIKEKLQFENNTIQNLFPTITFTNIDFDTTTYKYKPLYKTLNFSASGSRSDMKKFFSWYRTLSDFDKEHPTHLSKAMKRVNQNYNFEIEAEHYDSFITWLNDIVNYDTNIIINKSKTISPKNKRVKWFKQPCVIDFNMKGYQLEIDFLETYIKERIKDM